MMVDIALQAIDNPATHTILDAAKDARRLRRGDIIAVYLATDIATWSGSDYIPNEPITSPRCGFVFVTNVPDNPWEKIKNLMKPETSGSSILYRSMFRVQVADIPQAVRDRLIADRYATFTWTQVKNYVRRTQTAELLTDASIT